MMPGANIASTVACESEAACATAPAREVLDRVVPDKLWVTTDPVNPSTQNGARRALQRRNDPKLRHASTSESSKIFPDHSTADLAASVHRKFSLSALRFLHVQTLKKAYSAAHSFPHKNALRTDDLSQEEIAQVIHAASTAFGHAVLMTLECRRAPFAGVLNFPVGVRPPQAGLCLQSAQPRVGGEK
jgi:hypothetical protein